MKTSNQPLEATSTHSPAPAGYRSAAIEQERLLSVREARQKIGVSHTKIYDLFKDGSLKSIHIGRSRKVPLSVVLAFMHGTTA